MKKTIIKDKNGKVMTTKDKVELVECTFEEGDVFIPQWNSIKTTRTPFKDAKGVSKTAVNNKIKVMIKIDDKEEINYVSLTPAQAKSLQRKLEDKMDITQHLFTCFVYKIEGGENPGEYLGVGLFKEFNEPKSFSDFEKEAEEEEESSENKE